MLCFTFVDQLPSRSQPRTRQINYYQWVTLFLLVQAILFKVPVTIWRLFCEDIGAHIDNVVKGLREISKDTKTFSLDHRQNNIKALVLCTDRLKLLSLTQNHILLVSIFWLLFL